MAANGFLGWVPCLLLGCGRLGFDATVDAAGDADDIDASPDAPPIPLCDRFPTAIYCSEFEGGDRAGAGTLGAVAVPGGGWMGSDAYSVTVDPGATRLLRFNVPTPITSGEIHLGGRIFLSAGPPSANYVVATQALSASFVKISFDLNVADRVQIVNDVDSAGGRQGPDGSFPRDRWACFELIIVVAAAGGGGRVELLVDGVSTLAGFDNLNTMPVGGFTRFELGGISSPANTATETLVFDNWIISAQSIGCP